MRIELFDYVDAENGMTLRLVPENDIDHALLRVFGRHGRLVKHTKGLDIRAFDIGAAEAEGRE